MTILFWYILAPSIALLALIAFKVKNEKHIALKKGLTWAKIGAVVTAIVSTYLVFQTKSSTGALGIFGIPFLAIMGAAIFFTAVWSVFTVKEFIVSPQSRKSLTAKTLFALALIILAADASYIMKLARSEYYVHLAGKSDEKTLWRVLNDPYTAEDSFALAQLAKNQQSPPGLLLAIASLNNPGLHVKRSSYRNLVKNDHLAVMRHVARNPNVPTEALAILSNSRDNYVLGDVARHSKTPPDTLRKLWANKSYLVAWGIGANPNTPHEFLRELAGSNDKYARQAVARNKSAPPDTLDLLSGDGDYFIRRSVAANPATPADTLQKLANDPEGEVRFYISFNPSAPNAVLEKLVSDPDERASTTAKQKLQQRKFKRK